MRGRTRADQHPLLREVYAKVRQIRRETIRSQFNTGLTVALHLTRLDADAQAEGFSVGVVMLDVLGALRGSAYPQSS